MIRPKAKEWAKNVLRMEIMGAVCGALVITGSGCVRRNNGSTESIADIQKRHGIPVRVFTLAPQRLIAVERAGGTVEGVAQAELSSGVPGTLRSIAVRVGSQVSEGTVLATVDPDVASPYALAKAQYDQVSKSRERLQALAREGGVSQEVVDQVEAGYTIASAQLDAARKSVNIVAPFSGTVIEIMRPLNSKLGPGTAVLKLADMRAVRVTLDINESLIGRFAAGQKAFIIVARDTLWGKVEKVALGASERGHVFPVDVVFPAPPPALRPGMFVTVNVIVRDIPTILALPEETLHYDDIGAYVFVVENDMARKVRIKTGERGEGLVAVDSGLVAGQVVVAEGASLLADGARVKIVN